MKSTTGCCRMHDRRSCSMTFLPPQCPSPAMAALPGCLRATNPLSDAAERSPVPVLHFAMYGLAGGNP